MSENSTRVGDSKWLYMVCLVPILSMALGLYSVVQLGRSINQTKRESEEIRQKLEPSALYFDHNMPARMNAFNVEHMKYDTDVNGNGKIESTFIDGITGIRYVVERDQKSRELRIYPVKK